MRQYQVVEPAVFQVADQAQVQGGDFELQLHRGADVNGVIRTDSMPTLKVEQFDRRRFRCVLDAHRLKPAQRGLGIGCGDALGEIGLMVAARDFDFPGQRNHGLGGGGE